jgi:hypothetical protein
VAAERQRDDGRDGESYRREQGADAHNHLIRSKRWHEHFRRAHPNERSGRRYERRWRGKLSRHHTGEEKVGPGGRPLQCLRRFNCGWRDKQRGYHVSKKTVRYRASVSQSSSILAAKKSRRFRLVSLRVAPPSSAGVPLSARISYERRPAR